MTIRVLSNPFRTGTLYNLADLAWDPGATPTAVNGAGRTTGAALIDQIPLSPAQSPDRTVSILSYSVQAQLAFGKNFTTVFGRLGTILAGVNADSNAQATSFDSAGVPLVSATQPLPHDASLVSELWSPAIDDLPPPITTLPPSLGIRAATSVNLNQPLPAIAGTAYVGIWMQPSILPFLAVTPTQPGLFLAVYAATWSITYDDGE